MSSAPRLSRRKLAALSALASVPVLAVLASCGGGGSSSGGPSGLIDPGTNPFTNTRQATAPVCTANPHAAGRARWTVLMYINAASNLQDDSWLNVGQMASV